MDDTGNIILIGFMGAGKDSVGRELSARTNLKFLSTDEYIALKEKKPVARIINTHGEPYFRKLEYHALLNIRHVKNTVLATGGGMILDSRNRAMIKKMGRVVHLEVSPENVTRRLKNNHHRPLLEDRAAILRLHELRKPLYDFADIRIDTDRILPGEIAERLTKIVPVPTHTARTAIDKVLIKSRSRSYPVFIGLHLRNDENPILKRIAGHAHKAIIITNPLVGALFLSEVRRAFHAVGIVTCVYAIPDGETHKSIGTALEIVDFFFSRKIDRSDLAIALGGGVIGDITGFASSIYKRGIPFIQVPTTLLAQVDAAIGGKTGVNHRHGKNMIGTFHQPHAVFCDPEMLSTLSDIDYANGIAEVIKYSVIGDAALFRLLERDSGKVKKRDRSTLHRIITCCAAIKKAVVERDEREEKGVREVLNFGHTVGHAIEALTGYAVYRHGEAVAAGMAAESRIARESGVLSSRDYRRIVNLLKTYDLPPELPRIASKKKFMSMLAHDKKIRNGKIRLSVPVRIGETIMKEVTCERLV